MARITLIICTIFMIAFPSEAARPKVRGVEKDTIAHCSMAAMRATVERFCYEFQADPDLLFKWAYLNTGSPSQKPDTVAKTPEQLKKEAEQRKKNESKDGKDAIRLVYKDRTYNPETYTGDVAIDIYVLGSRMFKDNHLVSVYSHRQLQPGSEEQRLTAVYTGSLLDGGLIYFRLDSIAPNRTRVHYDFHANLGTFMATFISDKTWNNVGAWRLRNIFGNLIEYAETGKVTNRDKKKN